MQLDTCKFKTHLISNREIVPVEAKYTSKYSLMIRFLNGKSFHHGAEFSKMVIQNNGENLELGPCRLLSEPNIDGYAGRIIFLNDIYDLESLLFDNKIVKLQTDFFNLHLILAHKNEIRQSFKNYTADFTYDLSVYKNIFDNLDHHYRDEPEDIRKEVQKAIIDTEGTQFMNFLDDKLEELENIVCDFSSDEHKRHGFYYRKQLWNYILCSPISTRTNLKPRGYAGDSEMMRMIYLNEDHGDSTFSILMHKHPMRQPGAEAVRSRRDIIAGMLSKLKTDSDAGAHEKLKVLSAACGPAFEIKDLLLSAEDCDKFHFTLLDQDRKALFEAAQTIHEVEKRCGTAIKTDYLNESVRTMLKTPQLRNKWGQFHFIYSMGLFDYLTPPVATVVLKKLYQLLKPGGDMVVGNFHVSNPSRYYMEYWMDWVLYYRTEEEFKSLLKDVPNAETKVFFEETGSQMFLYVKKLKE